MAAFASRAASIAICPDGGPAPREGEYAIALDEAGVQSNDRENLDERYAIDVYVMRRMKLFPIDKQDQIYLKQVTGLGAIERQVIGLIHGNQALRIAADELLGIMVEQESTTDTGSIFQMPLFYTGRGRTEFKDGTWGGAAPDKESWAVRVLHFVGGDRVQAVGQIK